jgi:zinc transporter
MGKKDGLLHACVLRKGKHAQNISNWAEVEADHPNGLVWIHLDYASDNVQEWILQKSGLDMITAEALLNEDSRPRLVSTKKGLLLTLRAVNNDKNLDPEDLASLHVWLEKHRIITLRHNRVSATKDIYEDALEGHGPTETDEFLLVLLEKITDTIGDIIQDQEEEIDELEEEVLKPLKKDFRTRLLDVRQGLIMLRRYLAPQRDMIHRLLDEKNFAMTPENQAPMREIQERYFRYVEDLDALRDRCGVIRDEHTNKLSISMNKTMHTMSIVSVVFLPLNLITGLLGINVAGIPGADHPLAFITVCAVLIGLAIFEIIAFMKINKADLN